MSLRYFAAPLVATVISSFALDLTALAQWTDNAKENTPIVVKPGSQIQPKVAALADGGAYVSWFDNTGSGYDVFLQRIDQAGNILWNENGLLVADRSFSSTQDYGLSVDAAGYALLAFRDDRFGGVQITAARISPDGKHAWGEDGVQLTSGDGFHASPRIAGTSDGGIVIAWVNDDDTGVARLDAEGNVEWSDMLSFAGVGGFAICDVKASDAPGETGEVIVLLTTQGSFAVPRRLHVHKYDASGTPLWDKDPMPLFEIGSLQFGNFPTFVPDTAGGGVFTWYQSSPSLQVYAQRVDADGNILFAPGGAVVSTLASQLRSAPDVAFHATSQSTYVFWRETDLLQNQVGVYGQRFDAAGERQWTDSGLALVPVGSANRTQVRTIVEGDDVLAFFAEELASANQWYLGARLSAEGKHLWSPELLELSTAPSGKSRLAIANSTAGFTMLLWEDSRNDGGDIFGQNVQPDGTLGPVEPGIPGDLNGDGVVDVFDLLILLSNWGECRDAANCPADLNGDGFVDVFDLLILLSNWG